MAHSHWPCFSFTAITGACGNSFTLDETLNEAWCYLSIYPTSVSATEVYVLADGLVYRQG